MLFTVHATAPPSTKPLGNNSLPFKRTIQRTLRLALHHMMGVAVWAICQDQCEYHTIQKAEIPVWDILAWNMQVKVETSDWNNTE